MSINKSALFTERLAREDVEIDRVGTVTVRGLSRAEVLLINKSMSGTPDPVVIERKFLAAAMVTPPITEDDAKRWQEAASVQEIQDVVEVVNRLSGIGKDAGKKTYADFRDEP